MGGFNIEKELNLGQAGAAGAYPGKVAGGFALHNKPFAGMATRYGQWSDRFAEGMDPFSAQRRSQERAAAQAKRNATLQGLLARQRSMANGIGGGGIQFGAETGAYQSSLSGFMEQQQMKQQAMQQQQMQQIGQLLMLLALL